MKHNERLQALKLLTTVIKKHTALSQLLSSTQEVTPLTKELCFGVCRHYFRLQALADALVPKRPKAIEVWLAILLGLYQLQYLDIPEYAVVQETVALLALSKKNWAKALVNAVLRQFCRQRTQLLDQLAKQPEWVYGHPTWLLQQLQQDWPENWQSIVQANDAHPPMTLRVNRQKYSVADYLQILSKAGIEAESHPVAADALVLQKPCDVSQLPEFAQGAVSVQDAAAQMAVSLLDLKPGLRVLDACCAPGGKTCHILEHEQALAACVAVDVDAKRLQRVKDNLQRLHLDATLIEGNALEPPKWWDGKLFDRILLDAPCSATGVIRRHADIKLLRRPEEVVAIQKIQQHMLAALWPLLSPGGLLVYATCSVLPVENQQQIQAFLASSPDARLQAMPDNFGHETGYGRQILPGELAMDGFFYAGVRKVK